MRRVWAALKKIPVEKVPLEKRGLELLVKTILSQNTTDKNRDIAYENLKRLGDLEKLSDLALEELERLIRPCGLQRQKAKTLKNLFETLRKEPDFLKRLKSLPAESALKKLTSIKGVGVKTASIFLLFHHDLPLFPADTHIRRVLSRVSGEHLTAEGITYLFLSAPFTPSEMRFHHLNLIKIGRTLCKPRKPLCAECPLKEHCNYFRTKYLREESLLYHSQEPPGKVGTAITKPCENQLQLSIAYTPGVAYPCMEIAEDPETAYKYTNKGNVVAVITDGTAVLGLGEIGALASKPVMEGKALLFKKFAGVDAVDLEVNEKDPEKFVELVERISPSFGGINLEDISAPRCFQIEKALIERIEIPVFHDDQHGTAIIAGSALINWLHLTERQPEEVKVVVMGAGAAAYATFKLWQGLGLKRENFYFYDSKGSVWKGRNDLNPYKMEMASEDPLPLKERLRGADIFLGLSVGNILKGEDVLRMNDEPLILPLANPFPEIPYEEVVETRPDAYVGTGRSDYPNQVNNVLGFPSIFRGALDVGARRITQKMKLAAALSLAMLARKPVPTEVLRKYGVKSLCFGKEYLIPKPLDPRVLVEEASAVAQAAMEEGVARFSVPLREYRKKLEKLSHELFGTERTVE